MSLHLQAATRATQAATLRVLIMAACVACAASEPCAGDPRHLVGESWPCDDAEESDAWIDDD